MSIAEKGDSVRSLVISHIYTSLEARCYAKMFKHNRITKRTFLDGVKS